MYKFHWKNVVFLFMLSFSSLNLKAQTLTFEETVKYIMDKNACCRDYRWGDAIIGITKTGRITTGTGSSKKVYDIFELFPEIEGKGGMELGSGGSLWFNHDIVTCFQTASDAEKVLKAFKHLKTLCTPEVDPFGN